MQVAFFIDTSHEEIEVIGMHSRFVMQWLRYFVVFYLYLCMYVEPSSVHTLSGMSF